MKKLYYSRKKAALHTLSTHLLKRKTPTMRLMNHVSVILTFFAFIQLASLTKTYAQACATSDFSSPITLGSAQAANTWYTDRFAPASFSAQATAPGGRTNVLRHEISTAQGAASRSSGVQAPFYNTQGRKFDTPSGTKVISVDLYVPGTWGLANKRMAGIWGTAYNASGLFTNESYPIIEFTSDGGTPRFRGYESGDGTYKDISLPSGFSFGSWVTLKIELLPASKQYIYSVTAADGTSSSVTTTTHYNGGDVNKITDYIGNAILQGHNYDPAIALDATNPGVNYDIYWDNFGATTNTGFVTNVNTGELFCTIQAAIDDAETLNTHVITLSDGTYKANVTVSKSVTLKGANNNADLAIITPATSGSGTGLSITAPNVKLDYVTVTNFNYGVVIQNNANNLTIDHSKINNNVAVGVRVPTAATNIDNLIVDHSEIKNNGQGISVFTNASITTNAFNHVVIQNSDLSNNKQKGIYMERASDLKIIGITMNNSGTDVAYASNNGIDLNLQYGSYSDINIKNSTFIGSGLLGTGSAGAAATINVKARSDRSGSIAGVLIEGNTISGSQNNIVVGSYPSGMSNVIVRQNNLSGSFANKSIINYSNANIEIVCNWHGTTVLPTIKATFSELSTGKNALSTYSTSDTYTSCLGPVHNIEQNTYFGTIQAAIDDAATVATNHIEVAAGTYPEQVDIHKSVILKGANTSIAGYGTRGPAESILDGEGTHSGFIINANNVTIDGFKIMSGGGASYNGTGVFVNPNFGGFHIINNIVTDNIIGIYPTSNSASWVESNLFDGNNRPGSAGGAGIYVEFTNSLTIQKNEIKNHTTNSAIILAATAVGVHSNLIVTENNIHDNDIGSSQIYLNGVTNGTISKNIVSGGATGVKVAGGNSGISIINNLLNGNTTGIRIATDAFTANTGVSIHENSLVNTNKSIDNLDPVSVDAACNWYGSDVPGTVASKISGSVSYLPFTGIGTDSSPDPGFQPAPNSCIYLIHNLTTSKDFGTIQQAIDDATTVNGNIIKIDAGTFTEKFTVSKSLTFQGANAAKCGTNGTRVAETTLIAPTSGVLISLSGSVTATFEGFLIDGQYVANVSAASQNLTFKNSVFELDFLPSSNNLYFGSAALTLDCNYFKAIAGTNDGGSSHVLFAGAALNASKNKFTSEMARSSISASTTSLPVWINLTTNTNNVNIQENDFNKIDLGILIADNAGNVRIENNEFFDAIRQDLPFGSGLGAGIALFQGLSPAAPIVITKNKFIAGETGIRTSGNGTTFPASGLLTISYNSFESQTEKAFSLGSTYAGSANKLSALCNWFGAISGPIISTNAGAAGTGILDVGNKVSFRNWLVYGDATPGQIGFQTPTAFSVTSSGAPTVAGNDYRLLSNAVGCALENQEITFSGSFDYTPATTLAEWSKGNDGDITTTDDNYTIMAPVNLNGVKIIGASSATINGPGDLPTANLEGFLTFDNGYNRNWDISGLTIKDFDLSIGFFHSGNYPTNNSGLKIHDNTFYIPKDLNANAAPADVNQNIGIHLANGAGQIIENNSVFMDGTGTSVGTTSISTSIFLQSTTTGGNGYEGLRIINNTIQVKGAPQTSPNQAVLRGIWENSHSTGSDIEISGNKFTNELSGNTADLNRQFAFWVTSRSGAGKPVVYKNNEVTGYSEGISWLGGPFTSYTAPNYESTATPVQIENNNFTGVKNGVVVRKSAGSTNAGSPAIINNNSFTGLVSGGFAIVNESTGETDAECNWYDNPIATNVISSTGGGSVKFIKKLNNGTDNDVAVGFQPVPNSCVLPVLNFTKSIYYPTIQSAVDAASTVDGDEIRVSTGIYPENVVVNKGVTIIGADSANVIVDKGPANFGASGGVGFSLEKDGITLSKMKVQNFENGIATGTATTGVTISMMNVNKNYSNGFFGKRSATDLKIENSNFNSNGVTPGGTQTGSYMRGFMFEAQDNAVITNLKLINNSFSSNGLVGIDISGLIPTQGILIDNNDVWNNFDSQIGVSLGNNSLTLGETIITNNNLKVSGTARFGIEVKNPLGTGSASGAGSIVVSANTIAVVSHSGSVRDLAAIAVMRRKDGYASINDQPQGVRLINNIINNFQNTGGAFGIVLGGTGHFVTGNTITNTKISIQLQKGNTNFNSDANSPNALDEYFERDNSGDVCVEIGSNTIDGLSGVPRLVTGPSSTTTILPAVRVTNTSLPGSAKFCTIQQAIDFAATLSGHVLDAIAGDYPENVVVNKSVILQGPNKMVAGSGPRAAEASIIPPTENVATGVLVKIEANDVTVKGFAIDGSNSGLSSTLLINGVNTHAAFGLQATTGITGLTVLNNIVRNIGKHGIDLDAANGSTQGNTIEANLFDNIPRFNSDGYYGRGVLLSNNFYATVINNKFTRVERGIQTNNFSKAILGGTWEIKGNDITAYNIGAFINLHYQATTELSFENNIIDKDITTRTITSGTGDPLPDSDFTGVEVFSIADAVKVTLKGGVIKNAMSGIYSWNNPTTNHVTVDGVGFEGNDVAVMQSNFSRYTGATETEIDVKNVTLVAGNAVKAFVAEDHISGSGAISSINLVSGNVITSTGTFTHPFHLQGGTKARIKAGGTAVTLSSEDAFTFNVTGTSTTANVVIKSGLTVNLAGNNRRVVNLPAGLIMQMDGDFTAPNKVVDNPVLINGALWFNTGILNSGNGNIEFGNAASDIMTGSNPEKVTSYILGKAMLLSKAIGGGAVDMLGVNMGAGPSVGNLVITRTTKTIGSITPAFPADASIRTVWEITPSIPSASRGDVQFRYLNLTENVNSQNPAGIYAYRYNTAPSLWEKKSALRSSALVNDIYTTQTFGIAEFSSWTLSSEEPVIAVDLTVTIPRPSSTSLAQNVNSDGVISVANISANVTTGPVIFYVEIGTGYEITFDPGLSGTYAGLVVDNTQWNIVQNGVNLRSYTLTSKPGVAWNGSTARRVGYKIKGVGIPGSAATIVGELEFNTGGANSAAGDYDFTNDIGVRSFVIIP